PAEHAVITAAREPEHRPDRAEEPVINADFEQVRTAKRARDHELAAAGAPQARQHPADLPDIEDRVRIHRDTWLDKALDADDMNRAARAQRRFRDLDRQAAGAGQKAQGTWIHTGPPRGSLVPRFRSSPHLVAGAPSELWNQKGH